MYPWTAAVSANIGHSWLTFRRYCSCWENMALGTRLFKLLPLKFADTYVASGPVCSDDFWRSPSLVPLINPGRLLLEGQNCEDPDWRWLDWNWLCWEGRVVFDSCIRSRNWRLISLTSLPSSSPAKLTVISQLGLRSLLGLIQIKWCEAPEKIWANLQKFGKLCKNLKKI